MPSTRHEAFAVAFAFKTLRSCEPPGIRSYLPSKKSLTTLMTLSSVSIVINEWSGSEIISFPI
jgi:hypothetical protein